MCVRGYVCMYVCVGVCMYVCMYVYVHMGVWGMCLWEYVCVYVCMYVGFENQIQVAKSLYHVEHSCHVSLSFLSCRFLQ